MISISSEYSLLVRLLRSEDTELLQNSFPPSFLSFLSLAVTRHNIVCVSHLYANITIEQLGALLQTDPRTAEKETASLIMHGIISGSISQEEGIISFKSCLNVSFVSCSSSDLSIHIFLLFHPFPF